MISAEYGVECFLMYGIRKCKIKLVVTNPRIPTCELRNQ